MGLTPESGESRLPVLLANVQPSLHAEPFVFASLSEKETARLRVSPLAVFGEAEGLSVVVRQTEADQLGLRYDSVWAVITLKVHSSLSAVGFLAALLPPLAAASISVNPISAFHHDYLFVPWDRRDEAMSLLHSIAKHSGNAPTSDL